jgi:hypothetical protein
MQETRQQVIKSKLTQPVLASKKAIYAGVAAFLVAATVFVAFGILLKHAEAAKEVVELSSTAIMAFMALAVTLITGQSAFDWKAVSALQHMSEDTTIERIERNQHNVAIDSNQPIQNLNVSTASEISQPATTQEVIVGSFRSPKDFLGRDLSL